MRVSGLRELRALVECVVWKGTGSPRRGHLAGSGGQMPSPLAQGEELQASTFFSQLKPEKPVGQWQV